LLHAAPSRFGHPLFALAARLLPSEPLFKLGDPESFLVLAIALGALLRALYLLALRVCLLGAPGLSLALLPKLSLTP
jgi:hypothetical protein